jgi:hypothetical protein
MAYLLLQNWGGVIAPVAETDAVHPISGFNQLLAI